jgi:hypothetical protein
MKNYTQEEIVENMERCPYFQSCSRNLCPLDFELSLRNGTKKDKCRFSMEVLERKIDGREIIFGGRQMPDTILDFVPKSNFISLNGKSKKRWKELKKDND